MSLTDSTQLSRRTAASTVSSMPAGVVAFGDLVDTDDVVIEELFLTNVLDPRTELRDIGNGIGRFSVETTDALQHRPRSTRFEPVPDLRGFHHWFLHSYTSPSCLPDPAVWQ